MAGEAVGFCGCICVSAVLLLFSGIATLDPTEMALTYNWMFKTLNPEVQTAAGWTWIGPWNELIKYPKTIHTIQYERGQDLLDGRTKDGLPLVLDITYQYQLMPTELYKLYTTYEHDCGYTGDYLKIYELIGIHIATEMATNYTAYQFFNDKEGIAREMQIRMNEYFTQHLSATISTLQIHEVTLPTVFSDMITKTATTKQNITKTEKNLGAQEVQFETAVKVAQAQANVTIQKAIGQSAKILQNGKADAAVIKSYVQSELESYGAVKESLGLKGDDLLKYIWYDAVGGGSVVQPGQDFTVFSGIRPGAYMTEK